MIIQEITSSRLRIAMENDEGQDVLLGLNTGVPAGGFPAQRIGALARKGGVVLSGSAIRPWQATKLLPHAGTLYLCGPWLEGATIGEYLSRIEPSAQSAPADRLLGDLIVTVTEAYRHAVQSGSHTVCNTDTSLITADGSCLLLDNDLAAEINRYLPLERRKLTVFPYRFGRLDGPAALVYQCGAILWHLLTSAPLCTGTTQEESDLCHDAVQKNPAIHRTNPVIHPVVAEHVNRLVGDPEGAAREGTLEELLHAVATLPVMEEIDTEEAETRRRHARQSFEKTHRVWRRRRFLRRRGTIIAASIGIILIAGAIPFQIVRNRLAPPGTAGLPPEDLVSLFYESWGILDHTTMDEALARGVGSDILREVTNLYVIDRVQFAHSMEERIIPAAEWLERGRPESLIPYGPIVESIGVTRRDAEKVEVIVDYTMWRPEDESTNTEPSATQTTLRDRLTLLPTRWGWEIGDIVTTVIAGPSRR